MNDAHIQRNNKVSHGSVYSTLGDPVEKLLRKKLRRFKKPKSDPTIVKIFIYICGA